MVEFLEVIGSGYLTTVQDLGRPGRAHLGVPPSGALDRKSAALANRLVGNGDEAAVLETTLRGPALRVGSSSGLVLAVTGAPAEVWVNGRPRGNNVSFRADDGAVIEVGAASSGVRSYIAVRGGITVAPVLGSRSYDLLSELGPPPLSRGQRLAIGTGAGAVPAVDFVPVAPIDPSPTLVAVPGPRHAWFSSDALMLLTTSPWRVTSAGNRVGVRLSGPALMRCRHDQLGPEGIVTGSIQVPQDGQPVLFLADHPTTGGYPVIAVVDEAWLGAAAQLRPGCSLRISLDPTRRWSAPGRAM